MFQKFGQAATIWLLKKLTPASERYRVRELSDYASNVEQQIRQQTFEQHAQDLRNARKEGFEEGAWKTRDAYTARIADLEGQLTRKAERTWQYDRAMKHGDSVQDSNGKVFTLHEQQASEGAKSGPPRVRKNRKPRKSRRIQTR